jgi:TP901 family phage tail tape measure protein
VAERTTTLAFILKDSASKGMRELNKNARTLGRTASSLNAPFRAAAKGIAIAGAAAAAGLAYAVTKASEFETAMLNVNSIAKESPETFDAMKASVLDLSNRLPQSAETLAQGLYDIASSGFAGEEGLQVLEAAAKAASAGLAQTSESAAGITAVLNAYGLSADEAGRVSDVLFRTVDRGVITFPELASEIGKVTALAAPLGVSIEEVGAGIAVLTKNGIDASNATTQLNSIMQRFIKPSKEAQKVAASFGIELTSDALASKGLSGALTEMVEKTNGSKEALAAILGDARAIRGAFVLAKNGGEQFNDELALMQNAAGATDTALSYQEQGLAFQLQILSNNFTAMAIEIGTAVIPELIKMLNVFRGEILPTLALLAENIKENVGPAIRTIVGVFGSLIGVLGNVAKFLYDNRTILLIVAGAYTAFAVVVNAAAAATKLASIAMGIFNLVMAMNPIVLVVAAIAALVVGFIIAYNTIEPFRDLVNALFKAIQPLLAVVIDLALFIGTNIVRAFGLAVSVVSELAKILWGDGNGPLAIAVNAIGKVFDAVTAPIRFFIGLVQSAISVVRTLINLANSLPFIGGFLPRGGGGGGTRTTPDRRRALGGPVTGGQQYMVGERGPELFVPNQSGSIVPNNSLGGQINVTVQAGAFLGSSDDAREFARRIYGALNDEAKRRGTVLGGAR